MTVVSAGRICLWAAEAAELLAVVMIIRDPGVHAPHLGAIVVLDQNPAQAVVQVNPENVPVVGDLVNPARGDDGPIPAKFYVFSGP